MLEEINRRAEATVPSSTFLLKQGCHSETRTPLFLPQLGALALGFCPGEEADSKMENSEVLS